MLISTGKYEILDEEYVVAKSGDGFVNLCHSEPGKLKKIYIYGVYRNSQNFSQ